MDLYAHSVPDRSPDHWELWPVHAHGVAALAERFAAAFGCGALGRLAGLLHDLGKLSPEFQAYLRGLRDSGGDHSSAGARLAWETYEQSRFLSVALAAVIAGHHAGLADGVKLRARMERAAGRIPRDWRDHVSALPDMRALAPSPRPDVGPHPGFAHAFLIRMLFSALVDADFLATEAFMAGARGESIARGGHAPLDVLRDRLRTAMARKCEAAKPTELNRLRAEILSHAVAKAALPPGLFTLTVPTGGGKTLASLSFALEHAVHHGLERVIYVIPYTSIIEQTADVCRQMLGEGADILEHHASFDWEAARGRLKIDDEAPDVVLKLQRAAENWDVPIVVTTAVQFFESLFANRTSRCRKLHNIARSVVILDEVQTVPVKLLLPVMAALEELARNYSTSIVLCTATQPALRRMDDAMRDQRQKPLGFDIDDSRELAPDPARLYTALKRVAVERRGRTTNAEIAARFAEQPQMLCIVNTRRHAQDLFEAIEGLPGRAHLSTFMCPRHRRQVLEALRPRLKKGEPVQLVATSLIEAGVDIDFPETWRAVAGVDGIAQAAGRTNREGRLQDASGRPRLGRVVVFEPADYPSQHEMNVRWQAAQAAFRDAEDMLGLETVRSYFQHLYWQKGAAALDAVEIPDERVGFLPTLQDRRETLDFPFAKMAEAFRMIDTAMETVIVPWRAHADDREAEELLARIAASARPARADLRRLQGYVVQIPRDARNDWLARGVLVPVHRRLGEALLRFQDLTLYRPDTGVDIARSTYREAECNVF